MSFKNTQRVPKCVFGRALPSARTPGLCVNPGKAYAAMPDLSRRIYMGKKGEDGREGRNGTGIEQTEEREEGYKEVGNSAHVYRLWV